MSTAEITSVFAAMAAAWARSDARTFAEAFTADTEFTSVRGDHLRGSSQIAAAHERLFATVYAGTRLNAVVRQVSHPRPDFAIAQVENTLLHADGAPARGLGGNPGNRTHAQAVLERRPEGWKIVSFMNMVPLPPLIPTPIPTTAETRGHTPRPRIRHLAIYARRPDRLAKFYRDNFDMDVILADQDGNHFLSDGYLTLALLKLQMAGEAPAGMNHFGFQVDDLQRTCASLALECEEQPQRRASRRPFAEYRAIDIEGNWFDLSQHGYGVE